MKRALISAIMALSIVSISWAQTPEYKNPTGKEFPILAWYSVHPDDCCKERFVELREAGFNLSTSDFKNIAEMQKGLKACKGTGVYQVVSCPEMDVDTENTVKLFRRNKMTAAYFLRDEPAPKDFPGLSSIFKKIQETDPKHMVYLDLFPTYVPLEALGTKDYREYVERSVSEVGTGFISYDHYPVLTNGLRPDYYENLEIVSDVAREHGQPFWAFALAYPHGDYPTPTREHLRFQVFSDLAYGAQGLEYFTYWRALIGFDKKRNQTYDLVRDVNREVHNLTWVFLGCKTVSVRHTGESIPQGTKRLESLPEPFSNLSTDGEGLLVSHFTNNGKNFLMLVNRTIHQTQTVTIDRKPGVKRVMPDGSTCDAALYSNTMRVAPGDYLLFEW